jgi:hypothetical protein
MSFRPFLLISALLFTTTGILHATLDVIDVTTTVVPGSPANAEGYTFEGGVRQVTSFSTATDTYEVTSGADNVFIRRNAVNNDQSSVWYVSSGVGTNLSGVHQADYAQLLSSNNIFAGSDNTFANGTGNTTGNIERIDFTWNLPMTVTNALAFAVFDRGDTGVHDSFAIAAVTAVDAFGNPTAYGPLIKIAAGWGGATNPISGQDYRLFRYANGNNITATTDSTATANQGIGGIVITAADLGLTLGTNVYGYSLMAVDVTATDSTQLLDWSNSIFYPTTTDGNTGGGGIDLAAINGNSFTVVPEPVPNAILLSFVLLVSFCHWTQQRRARF